MILATDVYYDDVACSARAAAIAFATWGDAVPASEHVAVVTGVAPYEPGAFFKRELPCLLRVIEDSKVAPTLVVIDGYVDLAPDHPGLGRHLYDALRREVAVVGVAKTFFRGSAAVEILRGISLSPLYVTAAGMDADLAAQQVQYMHGPHRIPTLLQRVDALSRGRTG